MIYIFAFTFRLLKINEKLSIYLYVFYDILL